MNTKYIIFSMAAILLLPLIISAALPQTDVAIVGPVELSNADAKYMDNVTLTLYVMNNGPEDIIGPIRVQWRIKNRLLKESKIINLSEFQYKTIQAKLKVKETSYDLSVVLVKRIAPFDDIDNSNDLYETKLEFPNALKKPGLSASLNVPGAGSGAMPGDVGMPGQTYGSDKKMKTFPGVPGGQSAVVQGSAQGKSSPGTSGLGDVSGGSSSEGGTSQGSDTAGSGKGVGPGDISMPGSGTPGAGDATPGGGINAKNAKAFSEYYNRFLRLSTLLTIQLSRETDDDRKGMIQSTLDKINLLNGTMFALTKGMKLSELSSVAGEKPTLELLERQLEEIEELIEDLDLPEELLEQYLDRSKAILENLDD